jgi:stearoyl-CoA desaturase (delta-9 desaturase)
MDTSRHDGVIINEGDRKIDWLRVVPFILLHLACLTVFFVGVSTTAVVVALVLYFVRMFAITAFYHRYFSHRAFKTSRAGQFIFALIGASAVQRGAIWWAAHHRQHHRYSDQEQDRHSPYHGGFWWSHVGWILTYANYKTDYAKVPDLMKFPELVFLNRFDTLVPVALAVALFFAGQALAVYCPSLHTNGWQLLVWGFVISTIAVMHVTFSINSVTHCVGWRRYITSDQSRNNWWLAILTLGEGWHNNHHHYASAARQGFYWWEIDISYYLLRLLALLGVVWDLRPVPREIRDGGVRKPTTGA